MERPSLATNAFRHSVLSARLADFLYAQTEDDLFPLRVVELATQMGIKVKARPLRPPSTLKIWAENRAVDGEVGFEARLAGVRGDAPTIVYNSLCESTQLRHIFAHEIFELANINGLCFTHGTERTYGSVCTSPRESLADIFAHELLVPTA